MLMSSGFDYTFKGLDDQSIINVIIKGTGLPECPIDDYSEAQLRQLVPVLINVIRSFIAKEANISEPDIQEWIDSMCFKAKKDSKTSSMRPSSDMYRATATAEQNEASDNESDECPASTSQDRSASSHSSENQDEGNASGLSKDDQEKRSEEELRKDHNRSLRSKTGKKPGGQKGHSGSGFHIPPHVDVTEHIIVPPDKCKNCSKWNTCKANARLGVKHNVFDFEIHIKQTVYQEVWSVPCPDNESHEEHSDYPENARGVNQYGVNVQTIICLLYCVGMVSLDRIKKIVAPFLGLQLSTATIQRYISTLAAKVKETVDAILKAEQFEKVVHCDETGANVDGDLCWIHCVATNLYTFVSLQVKRGKEGMDAIGFLKEYVGTVVHDCWSSYWGFENFTHAVCNGHIQRELSGLSKFFHNANLWADDMISLMQEMLHTKHLAQEKGLSELSSDQINAFSERFDVLISRGKELHPLPERKPGQRGRQKRGRARALIDRMEERKAEIFKFLTDFEVPYTNNIAESSFRLLGTKRSVGCFRSIESAQEFCIIWSYLSTCAKHGISYYNAIKKAFEGKSMELLFPDREQHTQKNTISPDEAA